MLPWLRREVIPDATVMWDGVSHALAAREAARSIRYDLIIVQRDTEDADSFLVLRQLRSAGHDEAIVMLADGGGDADILAAADAGADDYVIRPIAAPALRARIQIVLRRVRPGNVATEALTIGDVTVDLHIGALAGSKGGVRLTAKETALLRYLLLHRDRPVPKLELLLHVWGYTFDPGTAVFDVALCRLRRKLDTVTSDVAIRAVRGHGFHLTSGRKNTPRHGIRSQENVSLP